MTSTNSSAVRLNTRQLQAIAFLKLQDECWHGDQLKYEAHGHRWCRACVDHLAGMLEEAAEGGARVERAIKADEARK